MPLSQLSAYTVAAWLGGLVLCAFAAYDAFANHSALASQVGDVSMIYTGVGLIVGKTIYDVGVGVPAAK